MCSQLSGLAVLSETTVLIDYLVNGYVTGLAAMVPEQVNVYSSAALRALITNSVSAVVNAAASSSSNMLVPKKLSDAIQQAYVKGVWSGAFSNLVPRQRLGPWYGAGYLTAFRAALDLLTPSLLAKWVPPTQASGSVIGPSVNVDTYAAQIKVDQNTVASGGQVVTTGFFDKYGIYVAAALVLLLFLDRGK